MNKFNVPTRSEVSESNQAIFDNLQKKLGFVPNLYAYYAKNDHALSAYLDFQGRKSSLNNKEKEVINLVVSQINDCTYCQSAHTVLAGMNGFTPEQVLDIRGLNIQFDEKVKSLAAITHSIVEKKGSISQEDKTAFFGAGYTEAHLIDVVFAISEKTISNYIHNIAKFEIDFPLAPQLELASA